MRPSRNYFSFIRPLLLHLSVLIVTGITLWSMGRVLICKCGYIKVWHGITWSSENSQHLTDWYTFSHIIHGFFFYWLTWKLARTRSLTTRSLIAIVPESAWEIWENTNFIIGRYRETTISLDYYGDSVINSLFDILAMTLGFWLAARLPVWLILILTLTMELFVGYLIRDNLTLNIFMLIYPFQAIKNWQFNQ